MLLQSTRRRSESRAHHQVGRRRVRVHAELGALRSLDGSADRSMRPTSRQRMQRLADELVAEGLVEFIDNPKHRRSKRVRLTPKGFSRYGALNVELLNIASTLGVDISEIDIRKASEGVRRLSNELKGLRTAVVRCDAGHLAEGRAYATSSVRCRRSPGQPRRERKPKTPWNPLRRLWGAAAALRRRSANGCSRALRGHGAHFR